MSLPITKPEQIKIAQTLRPDFPMDAFGGVWDTVDDGCFGEMKICAICPFAS